MQVKEHGRKVAKAAKKSGKKAKPPADPGIPKQWPFKQELISELDEKRRLILEAEAKKKAERKRARVSPDAAPPFNLLTSTGLTTQQLVSA